VTVVFVHRVRILRLTYLLTYQYFPNNTTQDEFQICITILKKIFIQATVIEHSVTKLL